MALVRCPKDINYIVFTLVALFAISSWIDINGLFVQLPILVENLPEKWNLPSYMSVIIQVANIGPLTFMISTYLWPRRVKEVPVIYLIILIGAAACLLLVFFWNSVTLIAGVPHSTALFTLQLFLALVDCTSSVAFYPFMALLKPQYMNALFIGESLSGLIPSLAAVAQGSGQVSCVNVTSWTNSTFNNTFFNISTNIVLAKYEQPRFSIESFFLFLFAMMVLSFLAFTLLNYLPYCKREFVCKTGNKSLIAVQNAMDTDLDHSYELGNVNDSHLQYVATAELPKTSFIERTPKDMTSENIQGGYTPVNTEPGHSFEVCNGVDKRLSNGVIGSNSDSPVLSLSRSRNKDELTTGKRELESIGSREIRLLTCKYIVLSVLTMWINGLTNGILPSVTSYSCRPYGAKTYHLAVTLSKMADPIACFTLLFVRVTRLTVLAMFTLVGTCFAGYLVAMAVMSPEPLLIEQTAGPPIIIVAWIITTFILTYSKVAVASKYRVGGRKALLWCGVYTQIGSAVGAFLMFIIINKLHYFTSVPQCS